MFARVGHERGFFFCFLLIPRLYLNLIPCCYFIHHVFSLSLSLIPVCVSYFFTPDRIETQCRVPFLCVTLHCLCISRRFCVCVIQGIWIDPYLPVRQQNNSLVEGSRQSETSAAICYCLKEKKNTVNLIKSGNISPCHLGKWKHFFRLSIFNRSVFTYEKKNQLVVVNCCFSSLKWKKK